MQTATTIEVEDFIRDCINEYKDGESGNGLFNADKNSFWSESFMRRMQKYENIKQKRSEAGKKAMQSRWGKQTNNKPITNLSKKTIKGFMNNNKKAKKITNVIKKNNKVITNVIKKYKNVIAKNNKLNQSKSNQIKVNKIKINEIKSIYPSHQMHQENKNLDEMMDEMEKNEFDSIIGKCEMHVLEPELVIEIIEILQEMYMNPVTRNRIRDINSKKLLYALKNFAIANTKTRIQIPKQYFKKCILSALDQTELSTQYDVDTIYEMGDL